MPVAIGVPGLDIYATDIPDGRIVLLEGDASPAKNHLALRIAMSAVGQARPVALLTTRSGDKTQGVVRHEVDAWPKGLPKGHDLVIDSFSLLAIDASPSDVVGRMRAVARECAGGGRIAILVLDDGQLDAAARSACHHLADGIIQFMSRDDADGPVPYLRIPKWMGRGATDKNLFYGFDGRQLLIDTRRRVN